LIAGAHRLEAANKLKWETIRCSVVDGLSIDLAELAEIDENLIRAELTPAEVAMHSARRKELYEKIHPATKHGAIGRGRKKSGQLGHSNERFTKETAKQTGQSERKVRRDVGRGNKVVVLTEIMGTCLDQGKELDALAKLSEVEQHDLADRPVFVFSLLKLHAAIRPGAPTPCTARHLRTMLACAVTFRYSGEAHARLKFSTQQVFLFFLSRVAGENAARDPQSLGEVGDAAPFFFSHVRDPSLLAEPISVLR
jgi:hypothetical protein